MAKSTTKPTTAKRLTQLEERLEQVAVELHQLDELEPRTPELPAIVVRHVHKAVGDAVNAAEQVWSVCNQYRALATVLDLFVEDRVDDQPRLRTVQESIGFDILDGLMMYIGWDACETLGGRPTYQENLSELRARANALAES